MHALGKNLVVVVLLSWLQMQYPGAGVARHSLVTPRPSAAWIVYQNDSAWIVGRMESIDQSKSSQGPINNHPKVRPFELSGTAVGCVTQDLPRSCNASQGRSHEDWKTVHWWFHEDSKAWLHEVHRLSVDKCWHIKVCNPWNSRKEKF